MKHKRGSQSPGPAQQAALQMLEERGRSGLTAVEFAVARGCARYAAGAMFARMDAAGMVAFREEPRDNGGGNQRRWFLPRFAPRDGDVAQADLPRVAGHRTGTLGDRWCVKDAPRVVDSSACSSWAAAAVACMERRA
jgi:hypothetical protein